MMLLSFFSYLQLGFIIPYVLITEYFIHGELLEIITSKNLFA